MRLQNIMAMGKVIGQYSEKNKTFYKKVQKSKHFCWKYHAWGIDILAMEQLLRLGCERVQVTETDNQKVTVAAMNDYKKYGVINNLGSGHQVFLNETHFKGSDDSRQVTMFDGEA